MCRLHSCWGWLQRGRGKAWQERAARRAVMASDMQAFCEVDSWTYNDKQSVSEQVDEDGQ
jgi:hypothetical protein